MRRCRLHIGIFCGSLALLSLQIGCANTDNPLQSKTTDQTSIFSEEKRIKPGIEPAKELDIQCFEPAKVNALAKTTNRAYGPCSNDFGVGLQVRTLSSADPDNGTFFFGDGTGDGRIDHGTITIGYDNDLTLKAGVNLTQEEVDMLIAQTIWSINYYNEHSNTGVRYIYSNNNPMHKVCASNGVQGGTIGGMPTIKNPAMEIVVGTDIVRFAVEGDVNILRAILMHEIGHVFGATEMYGDYGEVVPGTPASNSDDPHSVMRSTTPYPPEPILTIYDVVSFHYGMDNRIGLNHGLDFVVEGNNTEGTNWKNFVYFEYGGEIWTTGSDYLEWTYSTPSDALLPSGSFDNDAVMSGRIKDNQETWMGIKFNTQRDGTNLHFKYKLDSEVNYDFFEVGYWIGGYSTTRVYRMSGHVDWTDMTIPLPSAVDCRVIFFYTKDGSVSSGSDRAYVDHPYLSH